MLGWTPTSKFIDDILIGQIYFLKSVKCQYYFGSIHRRCVIEGTRQERRLRIILATGVTKCGPVALVLTHGEVLSGFPAPIVYIGNGSVAGVPVVMLIFIAVSALMALILNRTPFGQILHMLGSNEAATRYSGIDTRRMLVRVYVMSSLLAAVAGVVMMARFNSANAAYGESYLLVTILAAVLGGVSPSGGFGKVAGLILALVILQLISTAFNLLNFSQFLTLGIWGGTLIAVATVARLRNFFGPG